MDLPDTCPACGAQLEARHEFCWRCGASRGRRIVTPTIGAPRTVSAIRGLRIVYAAGAILFLLLLTQTAAVLAAPNGRDQLMGTIAQAGVPPANRTVVFELYAAILIGGQAAAAGLHAVAFYAMRRRRLMGWAVAMVLAEMWAVVLVGVPVLLTLLRPDVRREFGLSP